MSRLFNGQRVDGVSRSVKLVTGYEGANLYIVGDLGGGTIYTEVLVPDGTTWIRTDINEEITTQGLYVIRCSSVILRLRLVGAQGANVSAWLMSDSVSNKQFVATARGV